MTRCIKLVMICLLALSLPIQGFASALMAGCEVGHRSDAAQAHHATPPAYAMPAAAGPDHNGHMQEVSEHEGMDGMAKGGMAKSMVKCSACTACCFTGVAVPSLLPAVMPALDAAYSYGAPPAPDFKVNFPDGLERPPHTLPL
jgi:hypothetical protein